MESGITTSFEYEYEVKFNSRRVGAVVPNCVCTHDREQPAEGRKSHRVE